MATPVSSSTTVPCTCPSSATGGDGLDRFELCPTRTIENLGEVTERGWHSMVLTLERPNSPIILVPRVGHALVTVPDRRQIYMIGGGNHEGPLTEIWRIEYSGTESWEIGVDASVSVDFPPRYEFLCGLDKARKKIWVFGGADAVNTNNDVLHIDMYNEVVREVLPPPMVFDLYGRPVIDENPEVNPDLPSPRTQGNNSCIVEISGQENLIVFGGGVGKEKSVADGHLYMFNIVTTSWKKVEVTGSVPVPVQGHGMVAVGSKVYMFGGMEDMRLFNDFFMIDVAAAVPKWIKIRTTDGPKPAPRAAHGSTAVGKDIYVFGGVGEHGSLADLWKYDTEAREWSLVDDGTRTVNDEKKFQIQPRLDMAMTSVKVTLEQNGSYVRGDVLVVNGGMNTMGHLFDDTWIYPLFIQQ